MRALVIGGTGPTGPSIVDGLLKRGYDVTVLHRGRHESPHLAADAEHLHADPFDPACLREALDRRTFDLAIASYGRLRHVAAALSGRAGDIVAVGGVPAYRGFFRPQRNRPFGYPVPVSEDFPLSDGGEGEDRSGRIVRTENAFFAGVRDGSYRGCLMRYPYVYGPGQLIPREWSVIRRILDGRRTFVLPEGGLTLMSHGYGKHIAHAVLLAAGHIDVATGKAYNCGDQITLSLRQWVQTIAAACGAEAEVVSIPDVAGHPSTAITAHQLAHHRVTSVRRLEQDLGYRDLMPPVDAIAATTRWYLEHPLEPGGELERNLQDPFDYDLEDRCIELSRQLGESLRSMFPAAVQQHHPYD
jgi:nucleoside-diphosphate-sugar epimerase